MVGPEDTPIYRQAVSIELVGLNRVKMLINELIKAA
jgi:hypothetical protein